MTNNPEPGDLCEGCRKPNAWMLIDPIYKHVCGGCAEKGTADVMWINNTFRGFRSCSCGTRTMVMNAVNGKLKCSNCDKELFLGGVPPS
ncbi:hypothetical protein D3C85_379710 [compost metagenome]